MKSVLITGGAGYVGCVLVPKLLQAGFAVTVYDLMLFGAKGLRPHPNLRIIQGDIRNIAAYREAVAGHQCVIHMACISNDPSFELDPAWSRTINYECFEPLVQASKAEDVSRFIYASSSSVYGVSEAAEVTEEHPLVPLTDYNLYKGLCEPLLLQHQSKDFSTIIVRPATVCGYSPRMRFDLSVNILTNHAVNKGHITVFGGRQKRPNIHVEDLAELYGQLLTEAECLVAGQTFNVNHANYTLQQLAETVKAVVEAEMPEKAPIRITNSPSNDPRSYHISARKIAATLGFVPQRTVQDAVRDLCRAFNHNQLPNSLTDERYINVKAINKKAA